MGAPRRILEAKAFYAVTEFTQRCRGGCASETAPDNDDLELPPIVWTDQSGVITMAAPFLIERALWNFGVQCPNHRSEEHTSELQSHSDLVCRLLLEKKKIINT